MPDLTYAPRPGWTLTSDTWVYASATSFTIAGVDRTAQFPIGAKVQYTNGGTTKYAYVASAAFSTNTTVTLLANSSYSVANSAITEPKYSYQDTPAGFPNWGSADQNSALALEVGTLVTRPELKSGIVQAGHGATIVSSSSNANVNQNLTTGHDIALTRTDTGIIVTPNFYGYLDAQNATSMGYWLTLQTDEGSGYGASSWTFAYRLLSYVDANHLDRIIYEGRPIHLTNARQYSPGLFKVRVIGKVLYNNNTLASYNIHYKWEETL